MLPVEPIEQEGGDMKRYGESTAVEFAIGPHAARRGWEVARIVYDPARPEHLRQIEAAITALVHARHPRGQGDPTAEVAAREGMW
jgi:hypothetical protein